MPWERFVLGYHGCDQSIIEPILTGKKPMRVSRNDYDWLGHGVYFWEDSYQRAMRWALENESIAHPAVIGAVINLGECLNLLDTEHLSSLRKAYEYLLQISKTAEVTLPRNAGPSMKSRKLDCAVMETLHELREEASETPYQTVRGFFVEGEPLYDGAGFRDQDHIQLCVRDMSCIVGFFLPNKRSN